MKTLTRTGLSERFTTILRNETAKVPGIETVLPYHFDLLILTYADEPVREHIRRVGISIYS